jgi:hypothetical protein
MNTKQRNWRFAWLATCMALMLAVGSKAEETFETLAVGTNVFKNARIIQSSPVDLLIGHDDGFKRVKLQDLPEPLMAKHPYDAKKAADFEKQKAIDRQALLAQNTASAHTAWLAREGQLRAKIEEHQKELKRIDKNIGVQDRRKQGKGVKSADRKQADALRAQKMQVRDEMWRLQDELERTEAQRRKYE